MEFYDTDDMGVPEAVTVQHVRGGVAAERRVDLPRPHVMARLPDLDPSNAADEIDAEPSRAGRRLLSQGLVTKLLFGGGLLLVAIAVYPYLFGKSPGSQGGMPPAPDADEAPAWNAEVAETSDPMAIAPDYSYVPDMSFNADLPPAPDFITAGQAAEPTVPAPRKQPAENPNRAAALNEPWQSPAVARPSQADSRRPQAWANQTMSIDPQMATPSGIYADEYLRSRQEDNPTESPAQCPAASISYPMAEPGVARLEGVIEKPSVRTTYDSARSSVY